MTGKRNLRALLGLFSVVGCVLVFCVLSGVLTLASERTLLIGFTVSETGKYLVSSTRQVNGLKLWIDQVNDAGGIRLGDGTMIKFDSISYNDESDTERISDLYTRLITEDGVDFLVGPYSSGLTAAVAPIADQYGKLMITPGAASDAIYKEGYQFLFQGLTPASKYLTGAIDLLAHLDPSATKLAFVYEDSAFSKSVIEAAKPYAEELGFTTVLYQGYEAGTTEFGTLLGDLEKAGADAILGGGHFEDGTALAEQIHARGLAVKLLALLVAPGDPDFADLGDAALGVIGPSQWEPSVAFSPQAAGTAGIEWVGPLGAVFLEAYRAAYGEEPSYNSASGYAAGLILEEAIRDADSLATAAIKTALENMDILTFYGRIAFDTSAEAHGLQTGHEMVSIQWQRDAEGNLVKQVVWPLAGATAEALYPMP